jgi:hypothetical protein
MGVHGVHEVYEVHGVRKYAVSPLVYIAVKRKRERRIEGKRNRKR